MAATAAAIAVAAVHATHRLQAHVMVQTRVDAAVAPRRRRRVINRL